MREASTSSGTEKIQSTKSGNLFYLHENGGSRGAYNCQDGDGVWRDRPVEAAKSITRTEAEAYLISWGYDPDEILAD